MAPAPGCWLEASAPRHVVLSVGRHDRWLSPGVVPRAIGKSHRSCSDLVLDVPYRLFSSAVVSWSQPRWSVAGPIRVPEVVSTRRWGSLGLIAEAADHTTLLSNVTMNLVEKSSWCMGAGGAEVLEVLLHSCIVFHTLNGS